MPRKKKAAPVPIGKKIKKARTSKKFTLDRVANETADVLRDMIRIDPVTSAIQRNTFNILWDTLKQPTESTADERF